MLEVRMHLYPSERRVLYLFQCRLELMLYPGQVLATWSRERPESPCLPCPWVTSHDLTRRTQVILINGLSIPAIIWRDVAPTLATSGYRVLLYGKLIVHPSATRFTGAWQTSTAVATPMLPK